MSTQANLSTASGPQQDPTTIDDAPERTQEEIAAHAKFENVCSHLLGSERDWCTVYVRLNQWIDTFEDAEIETRRMLRKCPLPDNGISLEMIDKAVLDHPLEQCPIRMEAVATAAANRVCKEITSTVVKELNNIRSKMLNDMMSVHETAGQHRWTEAYILQKHFGVENSDGLKGFEDARYTHHHGRICHHLSDVNAVNTYGRQLKAIDFQLTMSAKKATAAFDNPNGSLKQYVSTCVDVYRLPIDQLKMKDLTEEVNKMWNKLVQGTSGAMDRDKDYKTMEGNIVRIALTDLGDALCKLLSSKLIQ